MNENIERTMEFVDSYNDGLNDGWHQGMDKGIEQNRKQMIIKMYQENIDINIISKCTNLSTEEIEKIIHNE